MKISEKIKCIRCNKLFSKKVKYCPFCGYENKIEIIETIPICPSCNVELEEEMFRGSAKERLFIV